MLHRRHFRLNASGCAAVMVVVAMMVTSGTSVMDTWSLRYGSDSAAVVLKTFNAMSAQTCTNSSVVDSNQLRLDNRRLCRECPVPAARSSPCPFPHHAMDGLADDSPNSSELSPIQHTVPEQVFRCCIATTAFTMHFANCDSPIHSAPVFFSPTPFDCDLSISK